MRRLALLLACLLPAAAAQGYRVEDGGGPPELRQDLSAAAALWRAAGAEEGLAERVDASALFAFGDAQLMGPDLVSLTLLRPDADPRLQALIHPDLYEGYRVALLHELGLVLGLASAAEGVMDPALEPGGAEALTEADREALGALGSALRGDLDGDGIVGLADLAELGRAYGAAGLNLPADLDGDGLVGPADLELLRSEYAFEPPVAPPDPTEAPAGGEADGQAPAGADAAPGAAEQGEGPDRDEAERESESGAAD